MKVRKRKIQTISILFIAAAVIYVILLVFSTTQIKEILEQEVRSQFYILEQDGEAVFASNTEQKLFGADAQLKFSDAAIIGKSKELQQMKEDMRAEEEGSIHYTGREQKTDSYISYSPTGINGWYFVEELPADELQKKNKKVQLMVVIVSVVTAAIFLLLTYTLHKFRRRMEQEQRELVLHDRLTGLPNRKCLIQFYEQISQKEGTYIYLLFHVNFFKRTNTMFGYETGSNLLKEIGSYLKDKTAEDECAGRASNDFFGLILKNEESDALKKRIDALFDGLGRIEVKDKHVTYDYKCYFTGGVCVLNEPEATLEEMNNRAYKVIMGLGELEQSQWAFFEEKQKEEQALEEELSRDIVRALQEKEFIPYFQPQYNIYSNEVVGAELLARWKHSKLGILLPEVFVPILEDAGCILDLDIIMLEEACRQLKAWLKEELLPVPLSLNFSMLNLHRRDFVRRVQNIVEQYDISPALISLEFKNSAVFANMEKATEIFKEFKKLGFKLSVDGFGTGDASFCVLEQIAVRNLKLDRALISRIESNEKSQILIQHIIKLSQELGLVVIAEGVETKEQMEFLQAAGCKFAQGFLFEKPCSMAEFEALIFR